MLTYEDEQWIWKVNSCFCDFITAYLVREIFAICEGEARIENTTIETTTTFNTSMNTSAITPLNP